MSSFDFKPFDDQIEKLRSSGQTEFANKLNHMIHKIAWKSDLEMLGELSVATLGLKSSARDVPPEVRKELDALMEVIQRAWAKLK